MQKTETGKPTRQAMTITTLSSREFNQDTSRAKKAADNGPVFITDRGMPAHVLLTIEEYWRITRSAKARASGPFRMPAAGSVESNQERQNIDSRWFGLI